jgi:hypothetical protein
VTAHDLTVLDLLDALLRIDSVNPCLDSGGAGEAHIAASVADWGRAVGLRTQVVEGTPGRPSVILRGGRNCGGRRLLLCGHLDTVGLAGSRDALTPRIDGDRIYARGAYDMKAGLARHGRGPDVVLGRLGLPVHRRHPQGALRTGGEGAHADDEWASRSGTSTATTVLTHLAQAFCSAS